MDFTLKTYKSLLKTLKNNNYQFLTMEEFASLSLLDSQSHGHLVIIMRHDVDRIPENSLRMAKLENELGIKASYYFRVVPESYDENVIRQIVELGHEIGYHYENLSVASQRMKNVNPVKSASHFTGQEFKIENEEKYREKLFKMALEDFEKNLEMFRKFYPVKTICMHGSPMSKWDNRLLWDKYDYQKYGIICEPYFDLDYNEVFYITDTGRRWDGEETSIRDKVESKFNIKIKSTNDLIHKINNHELPDKIMINVHPQRWTDKPFPWLEELVWQNLKNVIKKIISRRRNSIH